MILRLALIAGIFIGLGPIGVQGSTAQRCVSLFSETASKYETLATDLGLTYLKAPIPYGYKRVILNSRTYSKKDGTPGKKIYYYRYLRPDGSIIRPRLDADEYKEVVARFEEFKIDRSWDDVWISPDANDIVPICVGFYF